MDGVMEVIKNSDEPEWLESNVIGDLRLWQIVFLAFFGMMTLIVMVCCCFRFRIPRTKQQIEADYQRRLITTRFRQELETIEDTRMDSMTLEDALTLLHEKTNRPQMESEKKEESPPSSIMSQHTPQQGSLEAQAQSGQKPEPQVSGLSFVKFAGKVANLSKLGGPRSPPAPAPRPEATKMDF